MKAFLKTVCIILIFLMAFSLTVGGVLAVYVEKTFEKSIDESLFSIVGSGSDTSLYYYETNEETGAVEAHKLEGEIIYGGYRCVYADYESIPDDLKDAFVSIEDKRFYKHNGVDWKRTLSAGLNYFLKFSDSYGGSTITQQLIKNITDEDDYSLQRKIQEIFWALDLETKMDKKEILGLYLNIINLSQGCYGVGAAADYYFSKDVSELTLNECACIAAITNSPSYYDPLRNPENNKKRKDIILDQMYEQGYIDSEEYASAKGVDIVLNVNQKYDSDEINSWYTDMVVEDIINDLVEQKGYSRAMANLLIYTGGLKIYTAMDPEIQDILEEYYAETSHFYNNGEGETPQSSMIIIDPYNGDILGVAGAVGEKNANRIQNFSTQTLRPPGSVIKPLSVYAPAMEENILNWATVYDDVPVNFGNYNTDPEKGEIIEPVAWPANSNGIYRGLTNINYAIKQSINTVTVRALEDLGLEKSFDFLYEKVGLTSMIRSGSDANGSFITDMDVAALALGQLNYGVTVREITAAYSIFVNSGIYSAPRSYYKVTDSYGSILLENKYNGNAVISEENATVMSMMLENVVDDGTAKAITLKEQIACAGKTGTTQNNYDRWFIGYTPYFIGGVWFGYEYPKSLSGSNLCLAIWDDIMTEIHERKAYISEEKFFNYSDNVVEVEYCVDSGKLMTEACKRDPRGSRAERGYFALGNAPVGYCDCHIPVAYDNEEGGVSLEGMCNENVSYIGMITVERNFPMQIYVTDAQYVWRDIGDDIFPETSPKLAFFNNIFGENQYCGVSNTEYQFNRLCRAHFDYYQWIEKRNKY
ncbi:MAG: transglycosylase domain-containing protein [Clostridia bacterium]|nr:transglycosylase domain-containing protein [Clostridia bacterium]